MKKIDLKKLRSLAIGSLVVSPALITVAYAATCDECDGDWANCIGNASYDQGQCQMACDNSPNPEACYGACDNQYVASVYDCDEDWFFCYNDCTC